uniref:Plastocyanin-like domain-containing protein n=1 Tax=Naja naja TaxID=35670 RepID=A0A8C6VND9_NAJNA
REEKENKYSFQVSFLYLIILFKIIYQCALMGDILLIYFKNFATQPVSIHPQSAVYNKWSEGSSYSDGTFDMERLDDAVPPGQSFKYVWNITAEIGPKKADPPCLTYAYYSHVNMVRDFNSGLIGALLICKEGNKMCKEAKLFNREYVLMFSVFDESKNWYKKPSLQYTINGFANGTLPDVQACAYDHISWHLIGMSSSPEIFSVHFNGQTLEQNHYKVSTINLVGGASVTANMSVSRTGKWLISSLVAKHLQDCGNPDTLRKLSIKELRMIKSWEYFIAAEEITWDYAPEIPSSYLDNFSNFIGKKYKKAVFRQYKDSSFTKPTYAIWPKERGILGPVIRAEVRDTISIVFKNRASRPYSIYVHGVSVSKDAEGAVYPSDHKGWLGIISTFPLSVEPGHVYTYKWTVLDTDEPTVKDSQCITKLYHSAVDMTRDIASGLIGPLLVCKRKALDSKGVQVFFYLTIEIHCLSTLNGYASDRTDVLGFRQSEIVEWHLTSVGTVDEVVPVHLSGHTFLSKGKHQDILNLFPMSGESVDKNTKCLIYNICKFLKIHSFSPLQIFHILSQVRSRPAKTTFKKAIFRSYLDDTFQTPSTGGEYEKHLGILGPIIRAEVDDVIQVQFRNLASRPYSLHAHGLLYEKSSEGRITKRSGPTDNTEICKSWAYYSGVNPEKDIHSGLIGPILICQKGMIDNYNWPIDIREFVLFFMVFDEERSWYFEKSDKRTHAEKLIGVQSLNLQYSINGIPYQLQGLKMYKDENVHWHLLNMGGPKDIHVVNFHGQTFIEEGREDNQLGVLPLLPGK